MSQWLPHYAWTPTQHRFDDDWALHYEKALRHIAETAFASKDWKYAREVLAAAPSTPAREEALRLAGAAGLDPDPEVVGGVKEGS